MADTYDSLVRTQRAIKSKLTTIDKDLQAQNGAKLSQIRFDETSKKLEQCSKSIESHHSKIYPLCKDQAAEDTQDAEYDFLYNRHVSLLEELEILRPSLATSTPVPVKAKVKLPDLPTPHFDGNLTDWMSFQDLFNCAINSNDSLSSSQKLQYLQNCLSKEAKNVIKHLPSTDDNYDEAWKLLKHRFDNKREIITAILRRLTTQSIMKDEDGSVLRKLIDTTKECFQALKVLKQPVEHWDSWLIFIIADKLDAETHRQWVLSIKPSAIPTFEELCEFLDQRCRAISESGTIKVKPNSSSHNHAKKVSSHHGSIDAKCRVCNDSHLTFKCPTFNKQSVSERRDTLKTKNLCFNCLASGHRTNTCPSTSTCKKCQKKHHTMVHIDSSTPQVSSLTTYRHQLPSHVLLPTAIINIQDKQGNWMPFRALLDSASEASFVTETCVNKLALPTKSINLTIKGVSSTTVGSSTQMVQIQVSSRIYEYSATIDAYVMKQVTGRLPSSMVNPAKLTYIQGLKLADPFYYKPEDIDLLIGADLFSSLQRPTPVLMGLPGMPNATDTQFGWVVSGTINSSKPTIVRTHHANCQLESIMQKFWELESLPEMPTLTSEEAACEKHYNGTFQRLDNGRYMVRLPIKETSPPLGSTRDMAIRRLLQVERRLHSNPDLRKQYVDVLREYIQLGHMERVPPHQVRESTSTYYMPHHCIIKDSSTTTKVRVVFDASAKSSSGISLNEKCMVGPKTQDDLLAILMRFRMWMVAITADVRKMYPQFLVHPDDRDLQRIVWRETPDDPIEDWRMTGVTFGHASAPYLATRSLNQLARDESSRYPLASEVTQRDTYVDDLMTGTNSPSEAEVLQSQLLKMFSSAHLELRKWSSNSPSLLQHLPSEYCETKLPLVFDSDNTVKTLGLQWNPATDMFSFSVNLPLRRPLHTKRTLLSDISKIFDPMGWLAPITIRTKILFQSLWALKISWDESLPANVVEEWNAYRSNLSSIELIKIPRFVCLPNPTCYEILGFCDASQKAYAAVVYLKTTNDEGDCKVQLFTSKTRVAPVNQESIPRLELCGATLLVSLIDSVRKSVLEPITNVYMWTDSTIVLDWLSSSSSRWKVFVANRVSKIQQSYPRHHWHHVISHENPADVASRGIDPSDLKEDSLWWNGPSWVMQPAFNFSQEIGSTSTVPTEERKVKIHSCHVSLDITIIEKMPSLTKLKRVVAYCRRFLHNYLHPQAIQLKGELSVLELNQALNSCIKLVQMTFFPSELKCLTSNQPIPNKSKLLCLSPFLGSDGLLRVGGRLRNADLTPDKKYPIVIPKNCALTQLIVAEEHIRGLHAGPQLLLSMIQQTYWIISGRDVVRQYVKRCLVCFRHRAKACNQKMSDLPAARVIPTRPFQRCGVDFAGPFTLRRTIGGRSNQTCKSYVCVFVCFVTRAIHLELVSDLTSDSFMASFKRFIARRGLCSDIYSDCGTNFVGADTEIKRIYEFVQSADSGQRIQQFLSARSVKWHFNPPSSPHFGGLWESGVRVVKGHLRRVIGTTSLNFEEYATLLAQVESCVNSRPLAPLSCNPEDLSALTPGHFLIGAPLNALPEHDLTDIKLNRLSRWQHCQQLAQHFWRRWHNEYLHQLQQRHKWNSVSENLAVGTMVLMKDERLSPTEWKLGRILHTHPGPDGLVRVVTVKTSGGELKRPIVKLCPLPFDQPSSASSSSSFE